MFVLLFKFLNYESVAEIDSDLAIEGTSGFLQTEIVVEFGISEVAALKREVVASLLYAVRDREVMRELVGHHIIRVG